MTQLMGVTSVGRTPVWRISKHQVQSLGRRLWARGERSLKADVLLLMGQKGPVSPECLTKGFEHKRTLSPLTLPAWLSFHHHDNFFFFLMWTIYKVLFLNLLQYCFCILCFGFWPRGVGDLSSPTRDWTHIPCIRRKSLSHWTTREVPTMMFLSILTILPCISHYLYLCIIFNPYFLPKQETQVWSLGWEDPLEEEIATCSSILAWEIPWTEEPGGLQSMGSQKSQTWLTTAFSAEQIHPHILGTRHRISKRLGKLSQVTGASEVAQWVNNSSAMQEM